MKKILYFLAALAMFFVVGCKGVEPDGPVQEGYTLHADRTTINAGETIKFTVTDHNGVDVTDQCSVCSDVSCYGSMDVRLYMPGTFIFEGHYNGDPDIPGGVATLNKVKVTVKDAQ